MTTDSHTQHIADYTDEDLDRAAQALYAAHPTVHYLIGGLPVPWEELTERNRQDMKDRARVVAEALTGKG